MNKIFKVIWNEARNAYVVVSEIAKNHGSKSCSTKKLLAMLIATGVMTCASFDVLAEKPAAEKTAAQQYVALKAADFPATGPRWRDENTWGGLGTYSEARDEWKAQQDGTKQIGKYTYTYDETNKYWVREGYVLTVDKNGGKYTPLSQKDVRADVAYTGTDVPKGILQSVTSTVAHNGVVTHSGDSLQKITAGSYAGVSHGGGTEVAGSWNYIINDSSWENSGAEYQDGYVDLKGDNMPIGFKTTDSGLEWDEAKQTYTYKGKAVDYRNMYVIEGKLGVFTNYGGSEVYTGTVYGKNNEILMTVKDNGKFYSYWAASVTDPSATMETYPVSKYNSDLAVIDKNITDLNKDIIKEVTLTKDTNSAIIKLVRNGGNAVDGAITVTSGGGTDGKDTFVKISNAADTEGKTFATGSKVEAIVVNGATTGIKINGEDYTIESGPVVSVAQTADKKTTTITVDGEATVITDTDTKYTKGNGIAIDKANAISVKLNKDEKNLVVDGSGLALNTALTGIQSITGAGEGKISFEGATVKVNQNTFNKDGRIQNVANGTENTDAVNFGQLQAVKNELIASDKDTHIDTSNEYNVGANNQIKLDVLDKDGKKLDQQVVINDVAKASDVGDVSKIADDLKNGGNKPTTVVDAVNNLNNKVGDLNYVEGGKGNYVTNGETTTTSIGKLDKALKDVADTAAKQHTTVSGSGNIVVEDPTTNTDGGKNYNVKLADNITVNSVTANTFKADQTVMDKGGLKVGDKVSVTATAVTAGKTSISDEGVKVGDKTYISADGLNANGQHITNVKAGEADTDAVNYGQLKDTNNRINGVENQVISNSNRINQLGNRVNKVGAGAAALAALHPMDFDPDDKLTFSAGYGNYGGENAAAIGAYYRPDEKVMFSVGGTVGNGENMVNAGVSFALDRTNHVSNSRTALAREVIDLRGQLAVMGAKMAKMEKALGMLDETKTKLFPDIPANHWAYEYIAKLAGNGYIEGYPDGNFGGDRLMTRYEFAAMLYRAIENGAALEEKIIKEFEPELGRIRVDRISGEDGDRDKIERVRVNDTKGERDHYGNKLAK